MNRLTSTQVKEIELISAAPSITPLRSTVLATGLAYFGLAVTGLLGYLAIRSQLYVDGDAGATVANLVAH
ncbi:MAG: DUF4386 family protein [Pseudonocardiales bacterium]